MAITGYLIDVKSDEKEPFVGEVTFEQGLSSLYELVKCDAIDIVTVNVKGQTFDVVVDDEGLLKEGIIPTVYYEDSSKMLMGNALVVRSNEVGGMESITKDDLELLENNTMVFIGTGKPTPILIVE